jgi:Spy/CpxP family protein refolding chaperone
VQEYSLTHYPKDSMTGIRALSGTFWHFRQYACKNDQYKAKGYVMKKKIIAAVLISGLTIATAASANWGWGGGPGYGGGPGCGANPQGQGMMYQQLDPATQEKIDTFFNENRDLGKQMAVKQAEKMALMRGDNPDPAAVAKVTSELFDLHVTMQDKAKAAGVDQYIGPMGGGRGAGMGFHGGGRGGGGMMKGGPRY